MSIDNIVFSIHVSLKKFWLKIAIKNFFKKNFAITNPGGSEVWVLVDEMRRDEIRLVSKFPLSEGQTTFIYPAVSFQVSISTKIMKNGNFLPLLNIMIRATEGQIEPRANVIFPLPRWKVWELFQNSYILSKKIFIRFFHFNSHVIRWQLRQRKRDFIAINPLYIFFFNFKNLQPFFVTFDTKLG